MLYALEMFFNEAAQDRIYNYYKKLQERGISSYLINQNSLPHISIGCFRDIDLKSANEKLNNYCSKTRKIKINFSSFGAFNFPNPCVYLSPTYNSNLYDVHRDLHNIFKGKLDENYTYYLPNLWVPHCTIDISPERDVILKSTELLFNEFIPFNATITKIGWVVIDTPVKHLDFHNLLDSDF